MSRPRQRRAENREPAFGRGREFEWIAWIQKRHPGSEFALGIGDDAAVWTPRRGESLVLSVDTQVEGVHFRSDWLREAEIGARAVTAGVSDLAAMAARPVGILVALVLPATLTTRQFRALFRGIEAAAERYGTPIAGGNLSTGELSLTITAIGAGTASRLTRRDGARVGDEIWVTGTPGLAHLGCASFRHGWRRTPGLKSTLKRALAAAERAYRAPEARLREARELARGWPLGGLLDISDGLAGDVAHIVESSRRHGVRGATLQTAELAGLPHLETLAELSGGDAARLALAPSDDYELCFTARPDPQNARRARRLQTRWGTPVHRVGRVDGKKGLQLEAPDGTRQVWRGQGWEHL